MITTFLCITSLFLGSCLFFSVKKNIELLDRLESVEDVVEKALDVLDDQHQKIEAKTKIEVFSDEPVVRNLVQDIVVARDAVLEIAKILNSSLGPDEAEEETQET